MRSLPSKDNLVLGKDTSEENFDLYEMTDVGTEYRIEYNHPLGDSPASIFVGILASLLDGNVGISIIVVGSLALLLAMDAAFLFVVVSVIAFALGLGYMFTTYIYRDTSMRIDSHGISFPSIFWVSLSGQLERHWSEIVAVRFANTTGNSLEDDRMLIGFADDSYVKLDIDGFTRSALKRFVLLLNTYRPDIKIRSDFSDLLYEADDQEEIKQELLDAVSVRPRERKIENKSTLSFTKIWESELRSRYSTTAYTPLEYGDQLQEATYTVLGQIAFGGLSAIYLAQDADERLIVLKESVLPESCDEEDKAKALEMFQREAKLLCSVSHRNISRVYDYFVEADRHYMVLQHIDGRTVRDYIQEFGKQDQGTALRWALELATTISYLHKLDPPVIHRDLTPDNMIIRKDGTLCIIDFGAANNFLGTATCTIVGKSAYIPLEQFQGKARPASDIYALGASLFFVLTGVEPTPFSESNPQECGSLITDSMNDLILDCTRVKLEDRIRSVDVLLERLSELQVSLY